MKGPVGESVERVRIFIGGRVQGVGFRPSVYRHAIATGMTGFVRNTPQGVEVEAQGRRQDVRRFLALLRTESPRQAHVESMQVEFIPPFDLQDGFTIVPSSRSGDLIVGFPPDLATCSECVKELFTAGDRRFRYPFINCVNCGPRFTIIAGLPYDRAQTSMDVFPMCRDCQREFSDPKDRRFDAQPNACPACGPHLSLLDASGVPVPCKDPLTEAVQRIRAGQILAIKGLGGYHLCCDARNDEAVFRLRIAKGRREKPFAVMFSGPDELRLFTKCGPDDVIELLSPAAPVVIVPVRENGGLSRRVSPDTRDVGALLPYTPLHHLLLRSISPLIMTSANISEEPIAYDDATLRRMLGRLADGALTHNRAILRRCDDSVVKIVRGRRLVLRRSRGFVPQAIPLPLESPPVLAVGAEMKNTFCITRGAKAFMSQHIGDLVEHPSLAFFTEAIEDLAQLLNVKAEYVAHDLHSAYESTRFAQCFPAEKRISVQHHHAHVASCMAEHGLTGRVIGVAFDGSGLGEDKTIWGGEFLVTDYAEFQRAGHLRNFPLPGGDEAIRHPPRVALAALYAVWGAGAEKMAETFLPSLDVEHRRVLISLMNNPLRAPRTSSVGRLFDAVSALLGLCDEITYEGQAAVRLQTLAQTALDEASGASSAGNTSYSGYRFDWREEGGTWVMDFAPVLRAIIEDLTQRVPKHAIALKFHVSLAEAVAEGVERITRRTDISRVVLTGGVFQNDLLLTRVSDAVTARGFEVYSHHVVPPNDGGISLGQAVVAMARIQKRRV